MEPASAPSAASAPSTAASPPRALLSAAGRALLWLGPVYLAGYLGLSGSWVLLGLALCFCWGHNRRGKRQRLEAAAALLEDERQAVCRGLAARHLPAWVSGGRGGASGGSCGGCGGSCGGFGGGGGCRGLSGVPCEGSS